MKKGWFCTCADTLREYATWERKAYELGLNLDNSPVSALAENLHFLMCDGNVNWAYDETAGIDWIIEWTCAPDGPNMIVERHGRRWILEDAGDLYDFLKFMNEYGWEDE